MLEAPFTTAQFFAVFAAYNAAIWPLQILVYALGVVAAVAVWSSGSGATRVIAIALAIMWAINGAGYHLLFFSEINPVARGFAAMFLLQSLLFAAAGIWSTDLRFEVGRTVRSVLGLVIIVYALLIYELLGSWAGHGMMSGPMFGVAPCPTTIFTLGMLMLARGRWVIRLSIIPVLWSLVGVAAARQLSVPEDYGMPVAALALCLTLIVSKYADARKHVGGAAAAPPQARK